DDAACPLREAFEQAEFPGRQLDEAVVPAHFVGGPVQHQPFDVQQRVVPLQGVFAVGPAQAAAHFRQHQLQVERFRDVVIAAVLESAHLVQVVGAGGYKNDRNFRHGAQLTAPVKAVATGQVDVEQHQVRTVFEEHVFDVDVAPGLYDLEVVAAQLAGQDGGDFRIIFDDENPVSHPAVGRSRRLGPSGKLGLRRWL